MSKFHVARSLVAASLVGAFIAGTASGSSARSVPAPVANTDNVTICHRTHSVTNPYVRITVDQKSVGNANSKHGGGAHDYWASTVYASKPNPNVYNPAKNYPANDKKWGDIIAFKDVSGNTLTGTALNVAGLNNTGIGASIFNGTGAYVGLCRTMNARDYYEVEKAAGIPPADILSDMNEMNSPDFNSALEACGGTFTGCDPSKLGNTSITIVTTTTTVAGAASGTTVPASQQLAAGKGGLTVKIWVDLNLDTKKGTTEPPLAGITVTISGPGGATKTGVTDANGEITFLDLDPGSWTVVSDNSGLDDLGLSMTHDGDGTLDWTSTVTVVAGQIASSEYAAAGSSDLTIKGGKTDPVFVKWAGPDNKLGTDDDLVITVTPRKIGDVIIKNLMAGRYAVSATGVWGAADEYVVVNMLKGKASVATIRGAALVGAGMRHGVSFTSIAMLLMLAGVGLLALRRRTA